MAAIDRSEVADVGGEKWTSHRLFRGRKGSRTPVMLRAGRKFFENKTASSSSMALFCLPIGQLLCSFSLLPDGFAGFDSVGGPPGACGVGKAWEGGKEETTKVNH